MVDTRALQKSQRVSITPRWWAAVQITNSSPSMMSDRARAEPEEHLKFVLDIILLFRVLLSLIYFLLDARKEGNTSWLTAESCLWLGQQPWDTKTAVQRKYLSERTSSVPFLAKFGSTSLKFTTTTSEALKMMLSTMSSFLGAMLNSELFLWAASNTRSHWRTKLH